MQYPAEVVFQRVEASPEIEASVFDALARLEQFCHSIIGCHVFIRGPGASDEGVYAINLKLRTPDCEITIAGGRLNRPEHRDLNTALHDVFAQAERELHQLGRPLCTCSETSEGLSAQQPRATGP